MDDETQTTIMSEAIPDQPSYISDIDNSVTNESNSGKKSLKLVITVVIFIIILLIAILIVRSFTDNNQSSNPTPTPIMFISPAPSPSPTPEINKSEYKIKIFNGTGIAGEAKYLKDILIGIGFDSPDTGNADSDTYETTTISYKDTVPKALIEEIKTKLSSSYSSIKESTKTPTGTYDIEIITGVRPGQTKPTSSPTSKPSESQVSPTATTTPSPTLSPTPTPTP